MTPEFIIPNWPAPKHIRAASTTRRGGFSKTPFDSLNTATHVGDDGESVARNRVALSQALALPSAPVWLDQVHGTDIVDAGTPDDDIPRADGSFSTRVNRVCVVQTADCLPVLLTDSAGSCVAALHAGWRGLVDGILLQGVTALPVAPDVLLAWLGPAIGPEAFEVGGEVREAMLARWPQTEAAFAVGAPGKYRMDIYAVARLQLGLLGIRDVHGGGFCTYSEPDRFFSYRRDGETGRMASLIWIESGSGPDSD